MSALEITLSDGTPIKALPQRARFFREGGRDLVEISFVGSKDTVKQKVKPEHMAQFRDEWNAFCDGQPLKQRAGTALTELVDEDRANSFLLRNVHTLEELAALNDAQCQSLGHGTLALREKAKALLITRELQQKDRLQKAVSDASATIGSRPAEKYASESELAEIRASVDKLTENMTALVSALSQQAERKKPGRKPKATEN